MPARINPARRRFPGRMGRTCIVPGFEGEEPSPSATLIVFDQVKATMPKPTVAKRMTSIRESRPYRYFTSYA